MERSGNLEDFRRGLCHNDARRNHCEAHGPTSTLQFWTPHLRLYSRSLYTNVRYIAFWVYSMLLLPMYVMCLLTIPLFYRANIIPRGSTSCLWKSEVVGLVRTMVWLAAYHGSGKTDTSLPSKLHSALSKRQGLLTALSRLNRDFYNHKMQISATHAQHHHHSHRLSNSSMAKSFQIQNKVGTA